MEFRLSGKLTKTIHFRAYVYDFFHLFWCEELEFCPDISNTSSICQALSLKWCIHRSVVGFKLSKCLRLKTAWIPHKGQFFIVNLGPLGHEVMPSGRMMSYTGFWWGNLRERDHLEDLSVDGMVTLKWIFKKWDGGTLTILLWFGTGDGLLWMR